MSPSRTAVVGALAFLVGWVTSPPSAAAQVRLIGADFLLGGSRLFDVDFATGAATNPRETGIGYLTGIAVAPNGTLYGMSNRDTSPNPNSIFTINPVSGASTLVGSTGLTTIVEGDLAFSPGTDVLYGLTNVPDGLTRQLFTINTTTGLATVVGPVSSGTDVDLSGLEFVPDGRLLALDTSNDRLLTINPATGAVLVNIPLSVNLGVVAGLARDPSTGILYAADGNAAGTDGLYRLNPDTGSLTLVGPTGLADGLASLAFVPEPGAAAALVTAGLLRIRRRR